MLLMAYTTEKRRHFCQSLLYSVPILSRGRLRPVSHRKRLLHYQIDLDYSLEIYKGISSIQNENSVHIGYLYRNIVNYDKPN